ncbi:cadherin-19 [Anolis carolinensis]|uniref:Cadherin 19 n=1 Tax=Anolis carolinensis TaxID=28377 RepID=G1KMS7_ANOCA|nr:PREDICTED: cadherin-19 isoform X1 [Anolis carolinensis]XP_016848397.1 PREDICTED: cadherin-19 isoform X1 [Anolis carolinensis]XP_016848398.1 PREDICTED: cadherin-19 isoform X1 [Anolis carolinensis]|eukprot:XP_003219746.2 PREDICTED: cadherin-19 isoform X1 [Anolis carolinensis]
MHCGKWLSLALTVAQFSPCFLCKPRCDSEDMEHIFVRSRSMKLSGILKMPFVHEERILTQPLISGQTKSDVQKQDSSLADNWPQFLDGPYEATVPEMSAEGTSVIQVTARGPDSMGARLFYSIPPEQPYFSVEPTTGIIRTLYPVDRETQDQYFVLIQARVGQASERSATTTVTINISDVNDNPPRFQHKRYDMYVSETAPIGSMLGKIMADDNDIGDNAAMEYIIEEEPPHIVYIITDNKTQEGAVILNKTVDYETQSVYDIRVKGINRHVDQRFLSEDMRFEDTAILRIRVQDVDEPPVFISKELLMEISEEEMNNSFVGAVSARDPDKANSPIRYSIVLSEYFSINAHNGTITVTRPLDREIAAWHNITVTATESMNLKQVSEVNVYIEVLDINEYAPEISEYYEMYVCENARSSQFIQTISAVDRDDPMEGHHFFFYLTEEATNISGFAIEDNHNNTARIVTTRNEFHHREQLLFPLLVLVADNGTPSLTSTNTLTVTVCECNEEVNVQSCRFGTILFSMGISVQALVAVVACILIILVFVLAIVALKQQTKPPLFHEKGEPFRENIVKYDDEGGGEQDTEAFDISALRTQPVLREHKPRRNITTQIQSLYRQSLQVGPESAIFREFIAQKLEEANSDPDVPPFDSLQIYAFEGIGSVAGSLSTLGSSSPDSDENEYYLLELDTHFKRTGTIHDSIPPKSGVLESAHGHKMEIF